MRTHRSEAAIQNAIQINAGETLRAGALSQQLQRGLQLRRLLLLLLLLLPVLRLLRVLPVCDPVRTAGAPEPRLPPAVHPSVLLLLAVEVRRVDVRVVLHGCKLLRSNAGELRGMLQAASAAVGEI
jgi:hypothetical protein